MDEKNANISTRRMKVADLKPAAYNPRRITGRALAGLEESITRFGLVQPIVWNKRTGNIVGGHQRLKVLQTQGVEDVDAVIVDLDEKDEIALNIALNNPAIQGDFDDRIGDLLKGIRQSDKGLFDKLRMNDLASKLSITFSDNGHTDPDDAPTPPTKDFDSKDGCIYVLGKHRLMCGDSTLGVNVQKLCGDVKMDLLLTDPPYNVGYVGKTKDALTITNDKMEEENFAAFLVDAFRAANSAMRPGASFYIWHACSVLFSFLEACRKVEWPVSQTLIWVKNSMVMSRCDYHFRHEPCLYGWKEGEHRWNPNRALSSVLVFDRPSSSKIHPTMKPVALFESLMLNSSTEGETVLDTFCGSGTTIIAAEKSGRIAFGMELDPAYCDAIRQRWAEFVHGKDCDWKALTKEA